MKNENFSLNFGSLNFNFTRELLLLIKDIKLRFDFHSSSNLHLPKNWPNLDISDCGQMTSKSASVDKWRNAYWKFNIKKIWLNHWIRCKI